jgi:hypothetical protein
MSSLTTRTANAASRASTVRLFPWLAATIVCLCLLAAFRIGIDRGFRDTVGEGNWGRILFGVGTAITQMDHGGYGYAMSNIIETVLKYGGLTGDPEILATVGVQFPANLRDPNLINAAIEKAARFPWPINPNEDVRGSGGDDLGFIDYVRLSFLLFGHKIQSLYYTYFLIFGISAAAFLYAFHAQRASLMLLIVTSVAQVILFSSNLFGFPNLGSIADPRFLSLMGFIPGLHLACLLLDRSPPSYANLALAILQSMILVFALWIRASAIWIILALAFFGGFVAVRRLLTGRKELRRIWSIGILLTVLATHMLWVTITLHPVYRSKGEISHHVFWQSLFYQLQFHPRWDKKYAASYDFATFDQLPLLAAKKYLIGHPPLDAEDVYLTPDRQYLRVAAAESYARKAFFEFFANDPAFVLESLLIYNPLGMAVVFIGYLSSLAQITATQFIGMFIVTVILAGTLAADAEQRRLFGHGALLVTGGFLVSLSPILLTVPNYPTMGDQYFALLVVLGCWGVLALATGLAMLLSRRRQAMDQALHAR